MKIGIDARMMGAENTRGIGRYIQELVSAMLEIAPENEYILVTRTKDHALANKVKTVIADIPWYSLKEQTQMSEVLKSLGADIVHVPHWDVPLFYDGPLVVTIHDLLLRHYPASAKASTRSWPVRLIKRAGFRLVLNHAIKSAKRVCVPTEFTKKDLISFYPEASSKVVVTGEGITSLMQNAKCKMQNYSDVGRRTWDVGRYLLYVGSAYPHKRLDLLLGAWKTLSKDYPDLRLVIAGELDVFMQQSQLVARSSQLERVEFVGKVSDEDLAELYSKATAFVFPSEFEGFGLSPLEALQAGCPVISSDAGPMPEVLGKNGVVYFKSGSQDGIIRAVKAVVDNLELLKQQAVLASKELAIKHSWKSAAKLTLQAYSWVLKNK